MLPPSDTSLEATFGRPAAVAALRQVPGGGSILEEQALRPISLQGSAVYGPVQSRRLGSSLGINLLPVSYKLCSSNCVYCQYGWTTPPATPERVKRAPELLEEIGRALARCHQRRTQVDCVTLAGNGEPTLHPDLEAIVEGLRTLRTRYLPSAKLAILSDATQLHRPAVRQALGLLDVRYMKLDAGDETTWRQINDPLGEAHWERMLASLKALADIILQCMFVQGSFDNTRPEQIDAWVRLVSELRPLSVQVYTLARAPAHAGLRKVPPAQLEAIASTLTARTGIPTGVYD